jgi:hypothetical protein
MPEASVRRDGTGNPDPRKGQLQLAGGIIIPPLRAQRQLAGGFKTRRYVSTGTLREALVGDFVSSTVSTPLS